MANYFTAFEIVENECRLLCLKRLKGGVKVDTCFTVPLPAIETEDIVLRCRTKGEALKTALRERKFIPGESILLLPKQYVTVRHVFLPSVEDGEIAQMAQFEAEKHIPFNVERHNLSHRVMKKEGVTGSHVLIAAADAPVVDEPLSILTAAGIQPAVASVSSVTLYNLFCYLNPNFPEEQTVALLHIGMVNIDLVILHKGILVFTRSTSHGLSRLLQEINEIPGRTSPLTVEVLTRIDLMGDEKEKKQTALTAAVDSTGQWIPKPEETALIEQWKGKLLQSIRQTHDFARREFDCPSIERIFISGEGSAFSSVEDYLTGNLGLVAEKIHVTEEAIEGASGLPSSFLPALGAVLGFVHDGLISLNLLPSNYIDRRKSRQKRQNIISLAMMMGGALVLAILYLQAYSVKQERLTEWYENQVKVIKPEVVRLDDMQKKTRIISDYVRDQRNALAILDYLSKLKYMPRNVSITEFKYTKGISVEFSGHALDIKDLNTFISDLEGAGFFTDVKIKQRPWYNLPNNRPKVINYTLVCTIKAGRKGEKK
jgi:type IV pilus assembly protein PilM